MSPSRRGEVDWPQVKALFDEAVLLAPEQRREFLLAVTADDALRQEVLSLLVHADAAEAEAASVPRASQFPQREPGPADGSEVEGQRLGPWAIVGLLGQGGMGEVLRARRCDGAYEGVAAIKVLKRGMDSVALLSRFAQERQALARLNHPHIARLFDAGLTADQRPYFVMELVEGQAIDRAVQGLALDQRLRLFLQLADAVAYAHRQLLVHRDLKPNNVLVDGQGQVKLLDFGIAKALEAGADAATTQEGHRPYTPHYASPEQVRGEPVGTGTDIYSLGVLLYQLLTGLRPYGRDATTPQAAARCVLEDTPTRPSSLSPELVSDPQWLATRRRLVGDLDNILLKALEKPLERRYASVDALAADIQAFLDGYPVSARPASVAYLLAKFVARNRWAVLAGSLGSFGLATGLAAALLQERAAVALGVVGLAGGLGLALVRGRQAARSRDLAESRLAQVQALLRSLIAGHAEALAQIPGAFAAREAMLAEAARNMDQLAAQSGHDRHTLAALGGAFSRLADSQGNLLGQHTGKRTEAEANARRALRDFETAGPLPSDPPEQHIWHARAHHTLAKLERDAGRPEQALQGFQRAEQLLRAALAAHRGHAASALREALASTLGEIGQTHDTQGMPNLDQPEPALRALREAGELYESVADERPAAEVLMRRAMLTGSEAIVYDKHDDLDASISRLREAARLAAQAVQASEEPDTTRQWTLATVRHNLAEALLRQRQAGEGLQAMELAWHGVDQLLRENPGNTSWQSRRALFSLGYGRALAAAGQLEQAQAVLLPEIQHWRLDPDATLQRRAGLGLLALAQCACASGDQSTARPWADEARQLFARGLEQAPGQRNLVLYEARALATLAAAAVGEDATSAMLRERALARYAEAERGSPLAADDRRDRDALLPPDAASA